MLPVGLCRARGPDEDAPCARRFATHATRPSSKDDGQLGRHFHRRPKQLAAQLVERAAGLAPRWPPTLRRHRARLRSGSAAKRVGEPAILSVVSGLRPARRKRRGALSKLSG